MVPGSKPAGGGIHHVTVRRFSAQSIPLPPLHHLDITKKDVERDVNHQPYHYRCCFFYLSLSRPCEASCVVFFPGYFHLYFDVIVHMFIGKYTRPRGRGCRVTSYIWHSTDVRAEWPPFSTLPGI